MLRSGIIKTQPATAIIRPLSRCFHYTNINFNDKPPSSDSPLKVFFDTFKTEVKKVERIKGKHKGITG